MALKLDPTLGADPSSTNSVRSMKNESLLPSTGFSSIGLVGLHLRFLSADTAGFNLSTYNLFGRWTLADGVCGGGGWKKIEVHDLDRVTIGNNQ